MDWHLTASDAFEKILIEPLAPDLEVVLRPWDGQILPEPLDQGAPTIFCQLPPPASIAGAAARVIWIPMFDAVAPRGQEWWDVFPPNVRVVAFSSEVDRRARAAGLTTLRLRYFADPDESEPANWDDGVVVSYWNRTGLVGPRFLEALCSTIGARDLLFRGELDPRVPLASRYSLPERLGNTPVTQVDVNGREDFIRATARANVVIAPRLREGVGLTFLEAMARGCCVFAYDEATMNEYIVSGHTGVLLRNEEWERYVFNRRWTRPSPYQLSHRRHWSRIASLNLQALGTRARDEHRAGRAEWLAAAARYRAFVLDG